MPAIVWHERESGEFSNPALSYMIFTLHASQHFIITVKNSQLTKVEEAEKTKQLLTATYTVDFSGKERMYKVFYDIWGKFKIWKFIEQILSLIKDEDKEAMKVTPGKIDIYAYDGAGNRIAVNETYKSL